MEIEPTEPAEGAPAAQPEGENPAGEPEADEPSKPAEEGTAPSPATEDEAETSAAAPATEQKAENPAESPAATQPAAQESAEPETYDTPLGDKAFEYEYEKDEDGILLLDENDDPIAILKEGQDIPVSWIRRASGELVLDGNGNPIATQVIPAKAVHVETLKDRLNADRTIDIYATFDKAGAILGDSAKLTAVLNGYDALIYTLQWQQSDDGKNWENVGGANENELEIVTSEDNHDDYWRVRVTITGLVR